MPTKYNLYEDEEWGGQYPPKGVACHKMWTFFRKAAAVPRAQELYNQGYITISNKYRMVGSVDREDWYEKLKEYKFNSPLPESEKENWRDFYIRVYSHNKMIIPSFEYDALKKIKNQARWQLFS